MKKLHYGWIICLCCALLLVCTVGFCNNVIPVYLPYLESSYLTGAQGSAIISIRCLFSIIAIFFVEQYYDRLTLRWGLVFTCLITVAGFLCFSVAKTAAVFYLAAAICGLGYGLGSVVPVAILIRSWFNTRHGLAIGLCTTGSGLSAVIFPPIITVLIEEHGLRTAFVVQSLFIVLVGVAIALLVRDSPAQMGRVPYGEKPCAEEGSAAAPTGNASGAKYRGVGGIGMACLLIGATAASAPGHFSAYFVTAGFDPLKVAFGVSVFGTSMTAAKLVCGAAFDRFGVKNGSTLFSAFAAAGAVLCCFANSGAYALMYVGLILMGSGLAMATLSTPGWAGDFSCEASYRKTLKWFQILYSSGGMLFSLIPGRIYDATGSYFPAYVLVSFILFLEIFCIRISYRLRRIPARGNAAE